MKFLVIIIVLSLTSCLGRSIVYSNINHTLIVTGKSEVSCEKIEFEYYDEAAFKYKSFNILAISKTFNKVFKKEDLLAKAKELNACKIVETITTSCASPDIFGESRGCWSYNMIYFVK